MTIINPRLGYLGQLGQLAWAMGLSSPPQNMFVEKNFKVNRIRCSFEQVKISQRAIIIFKDY